MRLVRWYRREREKKEKKEKALSTHVTAPPFWPTRNRPSWLSAMSSTSVGAKAGPSLSVSLSLHPDATMARIPFLSCRQHRAQQPNQNRSGERGREYGTFEMRRRRARPFPAVAKGCSPRYVSRVPAARHAETMLG
jgi:hypothetical protein